MGHLDRPDAAANSIFAELSMVRLKAARRYGETELPAGTQGAIVFVYRGGEAYEVEFIEPIATVLTLTADDLTQ